MADTNGEIKVIVRGEVWGSKSREVEKSRSLHNITPRAYPVLVMSRWLVEMCRDGASRKVSWYNKLLYHVNTCHS